MPATVAGICLSCGNGPKQNIQKAVDDFATLECKAVRLRNQRFDLANTLRYTEDSLLHSSNPQDTARLRRQVAMLQQEKERLTRQSREMANRIKLRMDSLTETQFRTREEKERFHSAVTEALKKNNCN